MYLSRLTLDPRNHKVYHALQDPYRTHALLSRAFAREGRPRVLFRVEPSRWLIDPAIRIIVQSLSEPDWSYLENETGRSNCADSKPVSMSFRHEQSLRFRLRANPSVKRDGKRLGIFGEEQQLAWLSRKGDTGGFEADPRDVIVVDEGIGRSFKKTEEKTHTIRILTVLYEGRLTVSDPEKFLETVRNGIGSAKGLGCGLLSLARV